MSDYTDSVIAGLPAAPAATPGAAPGMDLGVTEPVIGPTSAPLAWQRPPAGAPAAAPTPGDAVIDSLPTQATVDVSTAAADEARRGELLRWRVRNEKRAPEEQAEVMRLSTALGWTPDVVAGDLPKARNAVEAAKLDTASVLRAHPALADFLGDPNTSALARGDTERLTGLAYLFGSGDVPGAFSLWAKGRGLARDIHSKQSDLLSGTTDVGAADVPGTASDLFAPPLARPTWGSPSVSTDPERRPLTEDEKAGLRADVRAKTAEMDALRRTGDGVESLGAGKHMLAKTARLVVDMGPEMAKGMGATALGGLAGGVGAPVAGTAFWSTEVAPGIYWQLSELRHADGTPMLTDDEAKAYASAAAVPIGASMTVSLGGLIGKAEPLAARALAKFLPQSIERLTAAKGVPALLGRAVLDYGSHSVQGGLMMGTQSAMTQATEEIAKATHGADASVGAVGDAFSSGFVSGIVDFALIAGFAPARKMFSEYGQLRASRDSASILRDIGDNTRNSKLAQRDPAQFEALLQKFGPDKTVYLDRDAFTSFAQEQKVSPRDLAATFMGDKGEAYDRSVATGADLAIPASRWASKVVLAGHEEKLAPDARLDLAELSPRRAAEKMKELTKTMTDRADARGPAFEAEVEGLRKQLQAVAYASGHKGLDGKEWANGLSRNAATMALRMDTSLHDAIVRVGLPQLHLEGRNVLTGKLLEALNVTPEERAAIALPASDVLDSLAPASRETVETVRAAAKTPKERAAADALARAAYTDGLVTELGNQRAHNEFMDSPGAQGGVHITTDMPGLKARNDSLGQGAGDQALLAYGKAFSAASRAQRGKAHRMSTGDEFYAHFDTREQADAFLADFKARLAGPEGLLRPGDQLSTYAGVGASKEAALAQLVKAKGEAKAKYGDSRKGGTVGHGESFVRVDPTPGPEAKPQAPAPPKGETPVAAIEGHGVVSANIPAKAPSAADQLFDRAVAAVTGLDRVSVSKLQRKLGITFDSATQLVQRLEGEGIIGPADKGVRQVLPRGAGFDQKGRGTIRMRLDGEGRPVSFDIRALGGDKSTLAHETAHFLGWSLHKLAMEKGAPEGIRADYDALLRFGGWPSAKERMVENTERTTLLGRQEVSTLNARDASRLKELTAKEERISYGWEKFLSEGKAPTVELRPTFARFRRWMGDIYKGLGGVDEQYRRLYGQELKVSDEVRGVFGRMLAVDGEVERTKAQEAGVDFASILKLTPEQADQLRALNEAKYQQMTERLDQTVARSGARAASGFLYAERERIRAEVHDEVSSAAPYVARDFLTSGELRDPETGKYFDPKQLPESMRGEDGKPLRLSHKSVVELVGAEEAKKLKGITEPRGGADANELATLLSFGSGSDLVRALIDAPDKGEMVERETTARFDDAFGPPLEKNAAALSAVGADALRNPADIEEALYIRDALARELGKSSKEGGRLPRKVLDLNAQHLIGGTRLQELSPKHYADAERRAAKEAFALMSQAARARDNGRLDEGDRFYAEALHKWDDVVMSKLLARHATKAMEAMDAAKSKLERAARTPYAQKLGTADIVYADANTSILSAAGFKDGKPNASHLDLALAALKRDGGDSSGVVVGENGQLESVLWDSQGVRDLLGEPRPWDTNTVDEASNILYAVENLGKAASEKNKVTIDGKRMTRDALIEALAGAAGRLPEHSEPRDPAALSALAKVAHATSGLFSTVDANLTEMETIIDRLVGNDRDNPVWKLFVGERLKARDAELGLARKFTNRIDSLWKDIPKEVRKRMGQVAKGASEALPMPDTNGEINPHSEMTYGQLIMVALNLGNDGNKQRLLDGYGWTEGQVRAALREHLTKSDWTWVQGVWDSLHELYPELERVHIADTGMRPTEVEAVPFTVTLADGTTMEMKGGYLPARYDPRVTSTMKGRESPDSVESMMTRNYRSFRLVTDHAKERAEQNADLLNLNFDIVPNHVAQVIHDVSHRLYVKEVAGVVLDPRFQNIVKVRMGPEYEKQFPAWVQAVASQKAANAGDTMGRLNAVVSWAKSRATLAAVGFNVAVPLADLTNPMLPLIAGELSAGHLARVTAQLGTHWTEQRTFALANSPELQARAHHGNSMGVEVRSIVRGGSVQREIEQAAYWMMEASDRATATPVWLAKFNELTESGATHEVAVRDADALVRKYFPSSDQSMRAAWVRDRGMLGGVTFLYGFANKVYNMNRRTITNAYDAWREPGDRTVADRAKIIGGALFVLTGQAFMMGAAGDFLSGRGPKGDGTDDGNTNGEKWTASSFISEKVGSNVAGWTAQHMAETVGYQLPFTQIVFGGRGALPASGLLHKAFTEVNKTVHGENGPAESVAALGASLALGTGMNQATKTGKYIDTGLAADLRHGNYRDALSNSVFGDKGTVTPINVGSK